MQNAELLSYITQRMASGSNESDIMRDLLKAGWQRDEILKTYLHIVNGALEAEVPKPESIPDYSGLQQNISLVSRLNPINFTKKQRLFTFGTIIIILIAIVVIWDVKSRSQGPMLISPSSMVASVTGTSDVIPQDPLSPAQLNNINPSTYLTTWNFSNLPPDQRAQYYQQKELPDGTMQRTYWITVTVKTITLASGITFKAWAYDGQVPGPTLRATEGDSIIIHFINDTTDYHTIHFHGFHPNDQDGGLPDEYIKPGQSTTYSFTADPAGLMLYHCHVEPIAEHINEGMYGTFIIDPKVDPRPVATQDFIMEENSFDLTDPLGDAALKNGDGSNTIFAVNAIPFWYKQHPIDVEAGKLYRIYLVNFQSFDPLATFHLQGTNFISTPNGTIGSAQTVTNTVTFGEGQRSVLDVTFPKPGDYQFTNAAFGAADKGFIGTFHVTE